MKGEWVKVPGKYGSTNYYTIGKIRVGSVFWNSNRSRLDSGNQYTYSVVLPGLREPTGTKDTEEEAQKRVELLVEFWFNALKVETGK
jgi:hypothetical protein